MYVCICFAMSTTFCLITCIFPDGLLVIVAFVCDVYLCLSLCGCASECAEINVSTESLAPTTCSTCGIEKNTGKPSCCAPGGSWFKDCGYHGDPSFRHTFVEGLEACARRFRVRACAYTWNGDCLCLLLFFSFGYNTL